MRSIIIANSKSHLRECIKVAREEQGQNCDLNHIDISRVTDLSDLFADCTGQPDISRWDVRRVHNMSNMFARADYCGDLSAWQPEQLHIAVTMLTRHSLREMPKPCFYHWLSAIVENRVFEPHIMEYVHLHWPTMQAVGMDAVEASIALQQHWLQAHGASPLVLALPDLGDI